MANFTDDFESGVAGADIGASSDWTVLAGAWIYTDVVGDMGAFPNVAGTNTLRATADVGSPDMFTEMVSTELKLGRKHAVTARMNTTGTDFYFGGWDDGRTRWSIRRVTTGPSALGVVVVDGDIVAPTAPWATRLEVQDNAAGDPVITLYSDGVQKAQFTDTDVTKITVGNFGGMYESTKGGHRGSFSVGSLLVAPAGQGGTTVTSTHTTSGSGSTVRRAGAGVAVSSTVIGQGSTHRSGTASVTAATVTAGQGLPVHTGNAATVGTSTVTGTGTASSAGPSGSASVSVTHSVAGVGAKQTTGAADVTVTHTVSGLGNNPVGFTPDTAQDTATPVVAAQVSVPRQARWSFAAALTDDAPQHALDARSRRVGFTLDGPAEASFTLDGRGEDALYVDELTTDLLVHRDGVKMLRGRVGQAQDQLGVDAHTMTVQAADYRAMLDRRVLLTGDTLGFAQIDQSAIAWSLASASFGRPNGDLGITRGIGQTTSVLRDRTYEVGKSCGEAIDQLAEVDSGFEWDVDPELAFNIYYPQRGQDRTADVVLDYGGRIAALSRSVNPSDFANSVRVSGREASGDTIPPTPAIRTATNIATAPEGRFESQIGTDLQTTGAVAQRADYELTQRSQVQPSYSVTLAPGAWVDQGTFWLGDTVRLVVMSGRLQVDTTARVYAIDFTISDDGPEEVSVTLGRTRRSLLERLRTVQTRLQSLERR